MARVPVKSLAYSTFRDFAQWGGRVGWSQDPVMAEVMRRFPAGGTVATTDDEVDTQGSGVFTRQVLRAKVVLAPARQYEAFRGVALPPAKLRLPFQSVWVEFEKPVPNHDGQAVIVGALVYDPWADTTPDKLLYLIHLVGVSKKFRVEEVGETQLPLYLNTVAYVFPSDKTLADFGQQILSREGNRDREPLAAVLSFLYLLSAQNVRLEYTEGPTALNKKRVSRGKPPIPGYYNVVFVDAPKHQPQATGQGVGPGVRFDVRGHWRVLTKDRDEPKYVWVHPHQRGLKNAVYRPSVWALKDAQ